MKFKLAQLRFRRKFGVELEFTQSSTDRNKLCTAIRSVGEPAYIDGFVHNHNNEEWCCKTDSSCGYEAASRVFSTPQELKKAGEAIDAIRTAGAKVNNRCGFHVHIELDDFNESKLGKLAAWWVKIEGMIINSVPTARKANNYCIPLTQYFRPDTAYSAEQVLREARSHGRYMTLNLANWYDRKTIEFRIAEGTDDSATVKNWVRFLLWFIEKTKKLDMPENINWLFPDEMFETFGLTGYSPSQDTFYVFSCGVAEMRHWILNRISKYARHHDDKNLAKHFIREQYS